MINELTDIPLVLFAKAPIAGQVKTRLTDHCTQQQAADIAEILIEASLVRSLKYWPGKVYLSVWQTNRHPFITSMIERFDLQLLGQSEGDLGVKMQFTFDQLGYPAAILGCDAPLVTAQAYKHAYKALQAKRNVIGASEDGGYYLIGMSQSSPELFEGIAWGTDAVLAQTLNVASANQIELVDLPSSYDIDRWDDVLRASVQIPALGVYLKSQGCD